ncbi:MAG: exodeoxyribonuclease VII small subunit [Myxococcota bacterium]|nr:exodeoxyribonuclease VII small subunit [Myxococcota bacterium]
MTEQTEASFEVVIERLETLVGQLEDGGLSLDNALKLYEEGIALTRRGTELLDGVEQRIIELQRDTDGEDE